MNYKCIPNDIVKKYIMELLRFHNFEIKRERVRVHPYADVYFSLVASDLAIFITEKNYDSLEFVNNVDLYNRNNEIKLKPLIIVKKDFCSKVDYADTALFYKADDYFSKISGLNYPHSFDEFYVLQKSLQCIFLDEIPDNFYPAVESLIKSKELQVFNCSNEAFCRKLLTPSRTRIFIDSFSLKSGE